MNRHDDRRGRWAGVGALALLFVGLSAWTWNTWADPLVDFGRELDTPTRLSQGQLLYRDVAYLNGPLSPYLNAAVLRVGGASLHTLFSFNLLVLLGCAALLWSIARRIAGELSAFVCTAMLIGLSGFLALGEVGNYNFIAPYSHEMTHGLLLALASLRLLLASLDRPRAWIALLLGVASGLTLLTKPEIAIATVGAVLVGLLLLFLLSTSPRAARVRAVVIAALAIAMVPVLAWLSLRAAGLSSDDAWRGLLAAWSGTFDRSLHDLPFYRTVAGTIDLARASSLIALSAGAWSVLAMIGVLAGLLAARHRWSAQWIGGLLAAGVVLFAWLFTSPGHWQVAFRGLGVLALLALAAHLVGWFRGRPGASPGRIAFCVFALLLLAKVRFNVNLAHYGFVLALPAACVLAMSLLGWLPAWLRERGADARPLRAPTLAAFACLFAVYLQAAATFLAGREPIAPNTANELWSRADRTAAVQRLLATIDAVVPPNASLAVLPEGALVHAWTGRRSPIPYTALMPVEMRLFDENRVLSAFERRPPDFIVLNRTADLAAYGHASMPSYAMKLSAWLQAEYLDVSPVGLGDQFLLLRRRAGR